MGTHLDLKKAYDGIQLLRVSLRALKDHIATHPNKPWGIRVGEMLSQYEARAFEAGEIADPFDHMAPETAFDRISPVLEDRSPMGDDRSYAMPVAPQDKMFAVLALAAILKVPSKLCTDNPQIFNAQGGQRWKEALRLVLETAASAPSTPHTTKDPNLSAPEYKV